MSLWNVFWSFAATWAPPLVALWLCLRTVVSRDGQGRRLVAVLAAFAPTFAPLLAGLWATWTHAPGGINRTALHLFQLLPIVPALYLLIWAFGSRDERWMLVLSAVLGVIGIFYPLFSLALQVR